MSISVASSINVRSTGRGLVPLCAGTGAYLFFLSASEILLRDSDSYWQIRVGQWILDHGAMPYTDVFSFTRFGEPWISSSWLAQVLFAIVYGHSGWAGPAILSCRAPGDWLSLGAEPVRWRRPESRAQLGGASPSSSYELGSECEITRIRI